MLVVEASIPNEGIFFAGERLQCKLKFMNIQPQETALEQEELQLQVIEETISVKSPNLFVNLSSLTGWFSNGTTTSTQIPPRDSISTPVLTSMDNLSASVYFDQSGRLINGSNEDILQSITPSDTLATPENNLATPENNLATPEISKTLDTPLNNAPEKLHSPEKLDTPDKLYKSIRKKSQAGEPSEAAKSAYKAKRPLNVNTALLETPPLESPEFSGRVELSRPVEHFKHKRTSSTNLIHPNSADIPSTITEEAIIDSKKPPILPSPLTIVIDPKMEQMAWVFAQVFGELVVDPQYVNHSPLASIKNNAMYKTPGMSGGIKHAGGGTIGYATGPNNKDFTYPVLNTPPTILFCDEKLAPGDSVTCILFNKDTYELKLPSVLPPSHRGKIVKLRYKLAVGIQRDAHARKTNIVYIPFRVFGRMGPDGARAVYDVQAPTIVTRDEAIVNKEATETQSTLSPLFPLPSDWNLPRRTSLTYYDDMQEATTMQNADDAIQMSNKVSYEICKNNEHVAQLLLPRISFRLGETVTAVFSFAQAALPCYHISVFLESREKIQPSYSIKSKEQVAQQSRICHGETHLNTWNAKRVTIALPIPVTASPEFESSLLSVQWSLRAEFITSKSNDIYNSTRHTEGFATLEAKQSLNVDPFDCTIPLKVLGAMRQLKPTMRTIKSVVN